MVAISVIGMQNYICIDKFNNLGSFHRTVWETRWWNGKDPKGEIQKKKNKQENSSGIYMENNDITTRQREDN